VIRTDCTIHRQENTDDPVRLRAIVAALEQVRCEMGLEVVLPLHPRTRKILAQQGLQLRCRMIDPVGYFDMIELLKGAALVATDSGGLQKEAYFFGKPCVTLRDETEWTELISAGVNRLVGADQNKICQAIREYLAHPPECQVSLYGDGAAGKQIAAWLAGSR